MDSYLFGPPLIVAFVILSGVGVLFARRFGSITRDDSDHDIIGYLFTVAAGLYGILLGLVVVNAIETFNDAQKVVNAEATSLESIYLLAETEPAELRRDIRELCRNYTRSIIEEEWQTMQNGSLSEATRDRIITLAKRIIQSHTNAPEFRSKLLDAFTKVWNARRERIDKLGQDIPTVEWIALCLGGILTLGISYLFKMKRQGLHVLSAMILSTMIGINLWLILLFGSPYSGDLTVTAEPYHRAMLTFDRIDRD